jgi:hypothetical protein
LSSNPATKTPATKDGKETARTVSAATTPAEKPTAPKLSAAERRQVAEQARIRREKKKSLQTLGGIIALFIIVGGAAAAVYLREAFKPGPPGEVVPLMPSYHLASGDEPHPTYTTDPPTSGPHIGELAAWGVHSQPITKELQIHSLEDAGVVINYRPDLDTATVDRLAALTRSYSDLIAEGSLDNHVAMAPYSGLSNAIVLTAWRRIDRLDQFDEARIKRFIDAYKDIDHHGESGDRPTTPSPGP